MDQWNPIGMASLRLDEILVILLDHDDQDLVFYACGALVNLAADVECLGRLAKATPAVVKLAKLLADAPAEDPNLQLVAVPWPCGGLPRVVW